MKKSLLAVLFSAALSSTFAQDKTNDPGIKISWELVQRNYKNTGKMLSVMTITNTAAKPLPVTGWTVYFNGPDVKTVSPSSINVEMINGDFAKFYPGKSFKVLSPKASLKVNILSRALKNITDFPKGFYLVNDTEPGKGILVPTVNKSLLNNAPAEKLQAEKQYAQNAAVKDIPSAVLSPIFPTPVSYIKTSATFLIDGKATVKAAAEFAKEAAYLEAELAKVTGVQTPSTATADKVILIEKKDFPSAEAYELSVTPKQIIIRASGAAGAFYGIQSLKLLFPANAWADNHGLINIQGIEIKDSPRFPHRAFMMDVARNFQQKAEVLKVIELLSLYKVNVLHLHLNDDEGWRIAIPGLPELTELGSKRGHTEQESANLFPSYGSGPDTSNPYGSGYYTREDYIEILRYAADRHITVIPEFETPGHARAAIKSMNARYKKFMQEGNTAEAEKYLLRDLNDESKYQSVQGWSDNVLNPAVPSVYTFLAKVADETIAMYKEAAAPLKTIHFGGDEVPPGVWEKSPAVAALLKKETGIEGVDEIWHYYFEQVNALLKKRGLYLSGWEEIGLKKALVNGRKRMIVDPRFAKENFHTDVWNNLSGNEDLAYKLANAGYQVVLTNVTNMYLDLAYNKSYNEPGQYWGGYVDVDKPFGFIPFDYYKNQKENEAGEPLKASHFDGKERLTEFGKSNIVGLQAPLWSEIITSPERFEYLLLPKIFGLAERSWAADPTWATITDAAQSAALYQAAWSNFVNVVGKNELPRLNHYAGGFAYRIPTAGAKSVGGKVKANVQYPGLIIRYTTDGSVPTVKSKIYMGTIPDTANLSLRVFTSTGRAGETIKFHKK
jgi:hexosaminidase